MRMSARIVIYVSLLALSATVSIRLNKWLRGGESSLAGGSTGTIWLSPSDPLETMRDVLDMMQSEYVEKVEPDGKFAAGAVRSMLYTLDDPRTRYWTIEQTKLLDRQMEGKYSGIGAVVAVVKVKRDDIEQRRVTVIAPVPGGPADAAGIRSGDSITEIDGRWVIAYDPRLDLNRLTLRTMPDKEYRQIIKDATKKLQDGISWPKALEQLTQSSDKPLKLTIAREGAPAPIKLTVERGEVQVKPVAYNKLPSDLGYLRITQFTPGAAAAVQQALKAAGRVSGLIVDLRNNPGGPDEPGPRSVVSSASAVAGALGLSGPLGHIVRGAKRTPINAKAVAGVSVPTGKVAVLMNKGTSGVSEVIAAALMARAGAKLIGANSQGDSSYCKLVRLSHGAMTLTAGTFMTASGKPVPSSGLKPTYAVATGGPRVDQDAAVAKAVAVLSGTGGRQ